MTRMILTADGPAGGLKQAGRADIVIDLMQRFVWGPVPSEAELAEVLAPRTTQGPGGHWLDFRSPANIANIKEIGSQHPGLIELCQRCESVELWMETTPN